jgi:hypothetical protein
MLGYSKRIMGPFITVHYNGYVEVSMQGYCKSTMELLITVHYSGQLEACLQIYSMGLWGP